MECGAAVRRLRIGILALCLAVSIPTGAADRVAVLVVSADSPVMALEPIEMRKLFLGLPVSRGGRLLRPLRNVSDEQLGQVFLQHVVAMSQSAYDRRILSQVLQQGRPRPQELKTREQLIEALAADPLAVSYMWTRDVPFSPRLRIVRVLWTE
jgi:hypothetical protein